MKDFQAMKPREVEAYLREQVRKIFGNAIEDKAVISAAHGFYNVIINTGVGEVQYVAFRGFRKTQVPKIVKAMRALGSKSND